MGRYYEGDISGKFWFGIQNSNDISNLCDAEYEHGYCWSCGCDANLDDIANYKYCINCYQSLEEHQQDLADYEEIYSEIEYIHYYLEKSIDQKEIEISLNVIEAVLDTKLFEIIFGKDTDQSLYYLLNISDENWKKIDKELLARYCLGKQILKCFEYKESCYVECECF